MSLSISGAAMADKYHAEPIGKNMQQAESTEKPQAIANADKKLPGRDCKLYNGGVRQHMMPQYEVGNADRPECVPGTSE